MPTAYSSSAAPGAMTEAAPAPPLPPPPLPPSSQEPPLPPPPPPPDAAVTSASDGSINQSTLASACTTLERLRSLHSEREACTLFASSLLAHPLGANGDNDGESGDNGEGQNNHHQNRASQLMDPLHPSSLPGGVRDAWASLSRSARPLNVSGGEVEDGLDDDNNAGDVSSAQIMGEGTIITAAMIENELAKEKRHENEEYTLNNGQLSIACRTTSLKVVTKREGELVNLLEKGVKESANVFEGAQKEIRDATSSAYNNVNAFDPNAVSGSGSMELMNSFYRKLNEVKEYHSQNNPEGDKADPMALGASSQSTNQQLASLLSGQKRKHGHPLADGYDIASLIAAESAAVRSGEVFTPEELFGKYLDLVPVYDGEVRSMRHAFASSSKEGSEKNADKNGASVVSIISYLEFLSVLSRGLNASIPESQKLKDRRKYARFLFELKKYLTGFLQRTSPFLDVSSEVIDKSIASFEKEWGEKGGVDGWECRIAEASMASDVAPKCDGTNGTTSDGGALVGIDLSTYATSSDLEKGANGDELKSELARLGLKCGGTVSDRAARLFLTKDTPLEKLPAKIFAKKKKGAGANKKAKNDSTSAPGQMNASESVADRRVDIARLEAIVSSLVDQLRPTLEGTRRRIERRTTQTEKERDQELGEEINGAAMDENANARGNATEKGEGHSDDEDDEEDAPIYNPKNVPLGWDGKPIPYWLFKLHGLNHFYPCEICGNESYRGRRNFEKHFTESRHSYGMRCLSIPNTKHFHGVTKIVDAQKLWEGLRTVLEGNHFDVDQEEEYEDSHGNVLNRAQYEDLARQGLL